MKHKLGSRLPGEISTTSDMQMLPYVESEEELKNLLMREHENKKAGLNSTFKKLRSWDPVPSLHDKQKGGKWKQ